MQYFVHDFSTGERFGPASLGQLQQWVNENRLQPSTVIEDETGRRMPASQLPGLTFVISAPPAEGYVARGYVEDPSEPLPDVIPVSVDESGLVVLSYVCGIIGLGCPMCLPVIGFIAGMVAYNRGDERGRWPQYLNVVSLVVGTTVFLIRGF